MAEFTETNPLTGIAPAPRRLRFRLDLQGRARVLVAFFAAFALLSLLYRGLLWYLLYERKLDAAGFDAASVSAAAFWVAVGEDLLAALFVTSALALLSGCSQGCRCLLRLGRGEAWVDTVLADLLLITAGLFVLTHVCLVFLLQSGLTVRLLFCGWNNFAARDFLSLVQWEHLLFLAIPVAGFHAFLAVLRRMSLPAAILGAVPAVMLLPFLAPDYRQLPSALRYHPLIFIARDLRNEPLIFGSRYANRGDLPDASQMTSVRLIDPALVGINRTQVASIPTPSTPPRQAWNVIWFVLESVGAEYIFDTSSGNEVPMPFLRRMSREGLHLARHRASSNVSSRAGFSLFTGLYPPCEVKDNSNAADLCLPTIPQLLGGAYHSFVVHPASTDSYFPRSLLSNTGLKEIYDASNIHQISPRLCRMAIDEPEAIRFLIEKIGHARRPFFSVYWSFLAHMPYPDYGEEPAFAAMHGDNRLPYYKNLRVLDRQLERVFEYLREAKLLEDTILVFVGDHGEGFGQHPGFLAHATGTFDESYLAPAIFYQPKLFLPAEVTWNTSHVDMLPTLLDAMSIPYNTNLVQGESVLRGTSRNYVFTVSGTGDYLSLVTADSVKVSVPFGQGAAYAFDLARDPGETRPLSVENYPQEVEALIKFRNYQTRMVEGYQAAMKSGLSFHGLRHTASRTASSANYREKD